VVDIEVQEILREIRERVRGEPLAPSGQEDSPSGQEELAHLAPDAQSELQTAELLKRLEVHSRTTLRAWDKLPPLTSKRNGLFARLELWFKRTMRRATRWYAWEQVNFNAAVKDALQDITSALSNQEGEIRNLRDQLAAVKQMKVEIASHLSSFEPHLQKLEHKLASLEQRLATPYDKAAALPAAEALQDEVRAIRALVLDLHSTLEDKLIRLRDEQRARAEQLQDEQRVAFKQLSLEIKETAQVKNETGRMKLEG
jgi:DNA repair exonuclease SbcCD ATPase subunit